MSEKKNKFSLRKNFEQLFAEFSAVREIWGHLRVGGMALAVPPLLSFLTIVCEYTFIAFLYPLIRGLIYGKIDFTNSPAMLTKFFTFFGNSIGYSTPDQIPLNLLTGVGIGLLLLRYALMFLNSITTLKYSQVLGHHARVKIAERELDFGQQYFEKMKVGEEISLLKHIAALTATIQHIKELILQTLLFLGYFAILITMVGIWSVPVFLIMAGVSLTTRLILSKVKVFSKDNAKKEKELFNSFYTLLSSSPLIRAYNHQRASLSEFEEYSNNFVKTQMNMFTRKTLIVPLQEGILVLLIILGFRLSLSLASNTLGQETLVVTAMTCFVILKRMSSNLRAVGEQRAALSALEGALYEILEVLGDKDKYYVTEGPKEFKGVQESISIKNLTFSFDGKREVLKNVDLTIPSQSTVAIVGATGSGKSTLTKLIQRYYECPENTIFIDGEDIRNFSLNSIRHEVAHIAQDVIIINDTIRNNIAFGLKASLSEHQILGAIQKAGLTELIAILPKGLETIVGERGTRLSGGEKQRVAIARAILKPSSLVILDEATSALDSKTEKAVHTAMDEILRDRTSIIIAHRLSTILKADQIIVVNNGEVVEQGTLDELLGLKGYFFELWTMQQLKTSA